MSEKLFFMDMIEVVKSGNLDKDQITKLKLKLCRKHKCKRIPTDIEIMLNADEQDIPVLKRFLLTKPTRTISGVAACAIMSKPIKCKHGACLMCPSRTKKGVPQSYTGKEPASMRAMRNKFDSYMQVINRLEQYIVLGHPPEKIELIIMGGTFPSFAKNYQENFIMNAFKAMNDFSDMFYKKKRFDIVKFKGFFELPGKVDSTKRTRIIQKKMLTLKNKNKKKLEHEHARNEKSKIKCVGMTIETRADYGKLKHGNEMLKLGCTRIELGIQSVYDDVLKKIERGHGVKENIKAIETLKDLGFKLNFHYMPGLPGSSIKKDLLGFKKLFNDPAYKPDMLKIYPCMVIKDSKLYKLYKQGKFKPLNTKQAAELIANMKTHVPKYCRIMRVQRDIPTYATVAGVDRTNLRQYVHEVMKKKGTTCSCIRCREIKANARIGRVKIKVYGYDASNGKEFFVSAEDNKHLLGFTRLRFPSQSLRKEITRHSALIRELHVYGPAVSIGKSGKVQHTGVGRKLMQKAEQIAKKNKKNKILVISGVGVRGYYRKLGYSKQGQYMVKTI